MLLPVYVCFVFFLATLTFYLLNILILLYDYKKFFEISVKLVSLYQLTKYLTISIEFRNDPNSMIFLKYTEETVL